MYLREKAELQIRRGNRDNSRDNFPYFSMKTRSDQSLDLSL